MDCSELSVLVVDDNPAIRRTVAGLLKALGCSRVAEAGDGRAALVRLHAGGIDLVLSDINMPLMNGYELLQALQALPALKRLPLVLVATEARPEDIAMAAAGGAAGYMVRPFTREALRDKLNQIVHERLALA
jgi:two-component system, chemotaxis family, chemotaxis protein CheY